jgi:two-component system CitB family sensor kinase
VSRRPKLSTTILVSQVAILIVAMSVGFGLYARVTSDQLNQQYQQRALSVASAVAALPEVRTALVADRPDPAGAVQSLVLRIQHSTSAAFIVVIDARGVRLTHPLPALIGQRISEPVHVLNGQTFVDVDPGVLGPSADGFAPVFGEHGEVLGEVSAGIRENEVAGALARALPLVGLYTALALAVGAVGSLLLARRLKRITFGLELHEIARLLQEREAMLHGVREGVITFDLHGRVTLINDEARRLVGLRTDAIGRRLADLLPAGQLRDVLSGAAGGPDELVLTEEYRLVVNRMAVQLAGRPFGAVVTLRDRTEVDDLLRELTSTRGLTDALRAQQHEFANRMHTVAGLLELGRSDEALSFLAETSEVADGFVESVSSRIANPVLAALVVAKATVAAERAVTLLLSEQSVVSRPLPDPQGVVTILGNLIDNAIDAASHGPVPAHVTVRMVQTDDELTIRVSDTGPGIPPGHGESIFREGFSTKQARSGLSRGIGLALVQRVTTRLGGRITVTDGPGPVFTVTLPLARPVGVGS